MEYDQVEQDQVGFKHVGLNYRGIRSQYSEQAGKDKVGLLKPCGIELLKILHNSMSCMINKNCNIHSYNTRTRENYHLYPAAKNFTLQSFRHHAPKIWNSLSVEIRSCKTVNVLKKKLKKYLLTY